MRRRHNICFTTLFVAALTVATVVTAAGSASAERLSVDVDASKAHSLNSRDPSSQLRLKNEMSAKSAQPVNPTLSFGPAPVGNADLSCYAPFRNYGLPAVQLAGESGDWVVLAGVTRPKGGSFGLKGPALTDSTQEHGLESWYYTVEMVFIPKDRWSISTSLSFGSADIHDSPTQSLQHLDPLHLDIVFTFDLGSGSQMALDLGYGSVPVETRSVAIQPGTVVFDPGQANKGQLETQVFSACLNIEF